MSGMNTEKRRVFELSLESVTIDLPGRRKKDGDHLLVATLSWPRPMIAERVSVKTLRLTGGAIDLSESTWTDRILFKETVMGPFGVEVSLTERLSSEAVEKFLRFMGSSLFKLAGAKSDDMVSGELTAGVVKLPIQYLGKLVSSSSREDARLIGAATLDLHADSNWKAGKSVRIEAELTAPETIYRTTHTTRHGEASTRRRTLLKEGGVSGNVVLTGRVYD